MKTVLQVIGVIALLLGLLFMGQGAGVIMWPASSFMLQQQVWVTYGAVIAVIGVVLILVSRRMTSR